MNKAEYYAHKFKIGKNRFLQFAIQTRVDPNKIRDPGVSPIIWVLSGSDEEVRPYRLLVKIRPY